MTTASEFARQTLRAAVKIHQQLFAPSWAAYLDSFPLVPWDRLRTTFWRLRKVESRGWRAAAADVLQDVDHQARQLVQHLDAFRALLPVAPKASRIAPPGQIAADLAALEDEFEGIQIDLKARTLTVRTEPIELEDLWLGPFDIRLSWERIGVRRAYEVIAKDPQRPSRDEEVTHPHVRNNQLCEGEASVPIKNSLATGRILDFFLLVRQTLQTYNGASPYVAVEDWNGTRCTDCGYSMDADDASSCETCDERICSECSVYCRGCGRYVCNECSGQCTECEHNFCQSCLAVSPEALRCLCAACRKKEEESREADQSNDPPPADDAVCVGQAAAAPRPGRHRGRRLRTVSGRRPARGGRRLAGQAAVQSGERQVRRRGGR